MNTYDTWNETPPTEPGFYWLYGEDDYGSMGGHYTGVIPVEESLHYVEVQQISNGLMAVTAGRFMSLKKFDRDTRRNGHIGVWRKVEHPPLPHDVCTRCNEPSGELHHVPSTGCSLDVEEDLCEECHASDLEFDDYLNELYDRTFGVVLEDFDD